MKIQRLPNQLSDLRPLFDPAWAAFRRILRDGGDRPTTVVDEMEASLHRNLGDADKRTWTRLVIRLVRLAFGVDPMPVRHISKSRPQSERMLRAYFERLNAKYPHAAVYIFGGSPMLASRRARILMLGLFGRMVRARFRRGEARSTAFRALMPDLIEHGYGSALTTIYQAECLLRGSQISYDLALGTIINQVADWTAAALPGLVDRRMHRIRNAAAHGRWDYQPTARTVILEDRDGWRAELSLSELNDVVKNVVDVLNGVWNAVGATAFGREIGLAVANADPDKELADVVSRFGPAFGRAYETLKQHGWRPPDEPTTPVPLPQE